MKHLALFFSLILLLLGNNLSAQTYCRTLGADDITITSAVLRASLEVSYSSNIKEYGIQITTVRNGGINNGSKLVSHELDGNNGYYLKATSLSANTTYYYRAYVKYGSQYFVGDWMSFNTQSISFSVSNFRVIKQNASTIDAQATFRIGSSQPVYATYYLYWSKTKQTKKEILTKGEKVYTKAFTFDPSTYTVSFRDLAVDFNKTYHCVILVVAHNQDFVSEVFSFTTNNGVVAVDLGLPSGTKWSNCNLGAESLNDDGGFYVWGSEETFEKANMVVEDYNWSGEMVDPAASILGDNWHLPTWEQFEELVENCEISASGKVLTFTSKINKNKIKITLSSKTPDYDFAYFWLANTKEGDPYMSLSYKLTHSSKKLGSELVARNKAVTCSVRPVCK